MFIPVHQLLHSPRHEGFETIKPNEPPYDRLMSYRSYRLVDEKQQLRTSSMSPVHKHLKELKLFMDTQKFTSKYPILILDCLTRYVEQTDKLAIYKEQAYVTLPQFLKTPAGAQFSAD